MENRTYYPRRDVVNGGAVVYKGARMVVVARFDNEVDAAAIAALLNRETDNQK